MYTALCVVQGLWLCGVAVTTYRREWFVVFIQIAGLALNTISISRARRFMCACIWNMAVSMMQMDQERAANNPENKSAKAD